MSVVCPRCGRNFPQMWRLKRHLTERKTPCGGGRGSKPPPERAPVQGLADQALEISQLKAEIEALKAEKRTNVQMTQNVAVFIQSRLNPFGKEDTSHLTPQVWGEILDELVRVGAPNGARVITRTVRQIYSDPAHPENMTCYLSKEDQGAVRVWVGTHWELLPLDEVHPHMVTRACVELSTKQDVASPRLAARGGHLVAAFEYEKRALATPALVRPVLARNRELLQAPALLDLKHAAPLALPPP